MPKSKLRSSMSIVEVDSIQATREKIDIETVTVNNRVIRRPRFLRAQVSPGFRTFGSIETDEVEYDNYVNWTITKAVQSIKWAKAFGGSAYDDAWAVEVAPNGDIVVVGYTESFGDSNGDVWILRLDENGNIKWQKAYGGSDWDVARGVAIAQNGDIIVVGRTYSFGNGSSDAWVLRLDENGNIKWQKTYGGGSIDGAWAVTVADNGDIIVVGFTQSFGAGSSDVWVLRLDENGNVIWQKAYGGVHQDEAYGVTIAPNGDIIVVGWVGGLGAGSWDAWVLRLDANGNVKWQKAFGESDDDEAWAVTVADNGDIIVVGYTRSFGAGSYDVWVLRLDENGNVKWQKAYGGSDWDGVWDVKTVSNGDIVIAGYTNSFGAGDYDIWILRLDENGNIKWQKAYGGIGDDEATGLAIADNGDIIVVGFTNSFGAGDYDIFVLRLDGNGDTNANLLVITETSCITTDTNCVVTDTSCSVTTTSCAVANSNSKIVETNCTVTNL